MRYFKLLAILAVVGLVAWTATPAEAAFKLRIDDPNDASAAVVITDGGAGDNLPGVAGTINFAGSVGDWTVTVATGSSKPSIGGVYVPELNLTITLIAYSLSGQDASNESIAQITLELTDTDFVIGPSLTSLALGYSVDTGPDAILVMDGYTGSGEFDTSGGHVGATASFPPENQAGTAVGPTLPPQSSLTLVLSVTQYETQQTVSGDIQLRAIPEPCTLGIWGLFAAIGIAGAVRRRLRN
jgi:hypothetical protein